MISRLAISLLCAIAFAAPDARAEQSWGRDYFPNTVLIDQDGKRLRFYDDVIKGRVVAINFIYTSCGDVCPAETAQLRRVQELLTGRLGRDVFMYSISVDPETDTPAVLKRYMRMFDVGPGWSFLTGNRDEINLLQKRLGLRPVERTRLKDHSISMIFGNEATGQWIKRSPYDDPKVLAQLLGERLHGHGAGTAGARQAYGNVAEVTDKSRGHYLFKTRCMSCHTIGEGDRLGPDLAGVVAARPRDWLTRWLIEPDKMLAEKDPLALALKAKYRNLPMPNLGLNDIDAAALIHYMEQQDKRLGIRPTVGGKEKLTPPVN